VPIVSPAAILAVYPTSSECTIFGSSFYVGENYSGGTLKQIFALGLYLHFMLHKCSQEVSSTELSCEVTQ